MIDVGSDPTDDGMADPDSADEITASADLDPMAGSDEKDQALEKLAY